jgi:hypothetical protein
MVRRSRLEVYRGLALFGGVRGRVLERGPGIEALVLTSLKQCIGM